MVRSCVRLSDDFQEQIRVAIARRRLRSFQQAVDLALHQWLGSNSQIQSPAEEPWKSKEERRWGERFIIFCREGDPAVVEAVKIIIRRYTKETAETTG